MRTEGSTEGGCGVSADPSYSQKAAGPDPHPVLRWDGWTKSLDVQALLAKVGPARLPSSGCPSGQSSTKFQHFYTDISGLTSFGEVRTPFPYPTPHVPYRYAHTRASLLTPPHPPQKKKTHLSLQKVIGEMNRLGMMVDLSYGSDTLARQALKVSRAPVIFSHSAAKAVCDNMLNVPDDVLQLLVSGHPSPQTWD